MLHRRVTEKLRSRRGASITMALLLFLVCAVVGATILTAGTASAGRVSELAKMDRRYYAVASAAELLAHELSGREVVIERTEQDGAPGSVTVGGIDIEDTGSMSYLTRLAACYAGRETDEDALTLTFQDQTVYVRSVLNERGVLTLTLSDRDGEDGFQLIVTMLPAYSELGEWSETADDKTTTVTRGKVSWSVESMR